MGQVRVQCDDDDDDENEEQEKIPSSRTTAATGAEEDSGGSPSSPNQQLPFDMSALKIGDLVPKSKLIGHEDQMIHGVGDLGGMAVNPETGAVLLNGGTNVSHTEEGDLVVGDPNGTHFVLGRCFAPPPSSGIPSLSEQVMGTETCYHGSTKETLGVRRNGT